MTLTNPKNPPPNRKVKVSKEKTNRQIICTTLNESHCKLNSSSLVAQVELETGVCVAWYTYTFLCFVVYIFYDSDRKFFKRSKELRIKNKSFFTHCNPFFLQGLH